MNPEASLILHAVGMIASLAIVLQALEIGIAVWNKSAERQVPVTAVARILEESSFFSARVWRGLLTSRSMILIQILRIALGIWAFRFGLGATGWSVQLLLTLLTMLRFLGAWNGGSDAMTVVVLTGLIAGSFRPEAGLLWISLQSILSYFLSGIRKARNPRWWNGKALRGFLIASPVSSAFLKREVRLGSVALGPISAVLVLFQLLIPFLLVPHLVPVALLFAALFHVGNVVFFGLNRFFWIWIATFPALVWWATKSGLFR